LGAFCSFIRPVKIFRIGKFIGALGVASFCNNALNVSRGFFAAAKQGYPSGVNATISGFAYGISASIPCAFPRNRRKIFHNPTDRYIELNESLYSIHTNTKKPPNHFESLQA
jgi:hypothetical protein